MDLRRKYLFCLHYSLRKISVLSLCCHNYLIGKCSPFPSRRFWCLLLFSAEHFCTVNLANKIKIFESFSHDSFLLLTIGNQHHLCVSSMYEIQGKSKRLLKKLNKSRANFRKLKCIKATNSRYNKLALSCLLRYEGV